MSWIPLGIAACRCRQQATGSARGRPKADHRAAGTSVGGDVDISGLRSALRGCEEHGDWQLALSLLADLQRLRADHDGSSYAAVIAACEKGGEWGRALGLSERWERAPAEALRRAAAAKPRGGGGVCLRALQVGSHVGSTANDPLFGLLEAGDAAVLVEPVPELFQELVHNYQSRYPGNGFTFVNKAVSNRVGTACLHVPTSGGGGQGRQPDWVSQLGSLQAGHLEAHAREYSVRGVTSQEIEVETTTLNELIKEHRIEHICILHTDAEGHDFEILMDLDLSMIKPEMILFEHRHMDGFLKTGQRYEELLLHFGKHGYRVVGKFREDTLLELIL